MASKRIAALFDFDGTITRSDSMGPFLLFLLRHYPQSALSLPRLSLFAGPYALGLVSKEQMKSQALYLFQRVPADKREACLRAFHDHTLLKHYLDQAIERIRYHQEQGHLLLLSSASLELYMQPVADHLGFDHLLATRSVIDPRPQVIGPNHYGPEKVNRLMRQDWFHDVDWAHSWAYSDHYSDLPILMLCGNPVATNPRPALKKHAATHGWQVMNW